LRGEYGAAPAPVNAELQLRVLDEGEQAITCRPADNIEPELDSLRAEVTGLAQQNDFMLTSGEGEIDDVLTYALFPQVGLKFLQHRNDPSMFEPIPTGRSAAKVNEGGEEAYTVEVEGKSYHVTVASGGDVSSIKQLGAQASAVVQVESATNAAPVNAPLAGTVVKVLVQPGQAVVEGESIIILEAMKMETSISAPNAGTIVAVKVQSGDSCAVGDLLVTLA
jgi:oxaloacetate decarboxylase alpha subunit